MNTLENNPIAYVTRDIERAIGIPADTADWFIITNDSDFARQFAQDRDNILLIQSEKPLDTRELLAHPDAAAFIEKLAEAQLLVFKNTKPIERICKQNNWQLLNPPADLVDTIEAKISQLGWLDELQDVLPDTRILTGAALPWDGTPYIVQFNRAHTGAGTHFIQSDADRQALAAKFPKRPMRVSRYIDGPVFTSNNVVTKDTTLVGNISYQITGLKPFTDNRFATVGNDWALPAQLLTDAQHNEFTTMVTAIGEKFRTDGWRGLFGIDVVLDQENGTLKLIEVNARQPASTSYESILQQRARTTEKSGISTMEAHLKALTNQTIEQPLIRISDGAQIVQRVTENIPTIIDIQIHPDANNVPTSIHYANTAPDADLLRMFSPHGVMSAHNELNEYGFLLEEFVLKAANGDIFGIHRAGVIVRDGNHILLFQRHRHGRDYYSVPGGTGDAEETPRQTAIREIKEETTLDVTLTNAAPIEIQMLHNTNFLFITDTFTGTATLSGEESVRNSADNSYELVWVPIKTLDELPLKPDALKQTLQSRLSKQL